MDGAQPYVARPVWMKGLGDLAQAPLGLGGAVDTPVDVGAQRFTIDAASGGSLDLSAVLDWDAPTWQLVLAQGALLNADQITQALLGSDDAFGL